MAKETYSLCPEPEPLKESNETEHFDCRRLGHRASPREGRGQENACHMYEADSGEQAVEASGAKLESSLNLRAASVRASFKFSSSSPLSDIYFGVRVRNRIASFPLKTEMV